MKKYVVTALTALAILSLCGCEKKGPVEKAGERGDQVIDNIKHGDNPLKEKGPLEKAGESIDSSVKDNKDSR